MTKKDKIALQQAYDWIESSKEIVDDIRVKEEQKREDDGAIIHDHNAGMLYPASNRLDEAIDFIHEVLYE